MATSTLDIVIILLFLVLIIVIIGLNVSSYVDKKIGSVSINVPPIPQPRITFNVSKEASGMINIQTGDNQQLTSQTTTQPVSSEESVIEGFEAGNLSQLNKELPTNLAVIPGIGVKNENLNEFNKKSELKDRLDMVDPDDDRIVEYGDYICRRREAKPEPVQEEKLRCENDSIDRRFRSGENYKMPFDNYCTRQDQDFDPSKFYKNYRYPKAVMEPEDVRGYNIIDYNDSAQLYDIGTIVLEKDVKFPVGVGSIVPRVPLNKPVYKTYNNKK